MSSEIHKYIETSLEKNRNLFNADVISFSNKKKINSSKDLKINKVSSGSPHIVDVLNSKKISLVINTGGGNSEHRLSDAIALRRATLINKVPYCTNMSTAQACLEGIRSLKTKEITVTSLQDI